MMCVRVCVSNQNQIKINHLAKEWFTFDIYLDLYVNVFETDYFAHTDNIIS